MASFFAALPTEAHRAPVALAHEEPRPMADQAAVIISRALGRSKRQHRRTTAGPASRIEGADYARAN